MNDQAQTLDIRQVLTDHMAQVFKTMLSLQTVPQPNGAIPELGERVTGSIGFGGDRVTGALYLHMPTNLAQRLTRAMLGSSAHEFSKAEINDVVGEITNMLTGRLKSCLSDAGASCAMSTPAIIRGISFEIEPLPQVRRELLLFHCDTSPLAVEVHIKFK
jgi:CheY-specific phosphatase CheX